jgi:2-oxoisovalerate dehydrogenase E1 component
MPIETPLSPAAAVELRSSPQDWEALPAADLGAMLTQLHLIRAFEEEALALAVEGNVHGPVHSSIGQEGGAVGACSALRARDQIGGSHRGHHQFLAKALGYVAPGLGPKDETPAPARELMRRALAEIMGLDPGFGHGRGGSMHLRWGEAGCLGTNAIVGGGVPLLAGAAMAHKLAGEGDVAVAFFGDGAINIGAVLETFNLAAAWSLPLIFFCENNFYAVSTHIREVTREPRLALRGPGFGVPSFRVDGMDPIAVRLAVERALKIARGGGGPALIEAECYRYFHQNGPLPGSAFNYRPKEEEAEWRARDPLDRVGRAMLERGLLSEADLAALRERAQELLRSVAGELTRQDGNRRVVHVELWPDPARVDEGLRAALPAPHNIREAQDGGATIERPFVHVIADVLNRRFETDPRLVIMGEDIHRLKGGTNGATRDLAANFPDRVFATPIAEQAFAGLAGGLAMDGRYRPIVEFMYPDFMWVAADQVFNQIGKARHMFGGNTDMPLVLRTKVAMGTGYGEQHLMDPAGIFATSPGWRIVAPSNAADYVGLMNAALALNDPVLVIEHVDLYSTPDRVPEGDLDYIIPPGSAAVLREGSDVTVLTYLSMTAKAAEAIEQTGVDAELVDLRWLDRASLDWETIERSVRKTGAVVIVEQGAIGTSYGAWLADEIQRRLFDWLDHPIERVTGQEASPVISRVLETAAITQTADIAEALERIAHETGAR